MITLLIVDDEFSICELVKNLINWDKFKYDLELLGYANDGCTALDIIKSKKPDIVITDLRMPDISGIALIERASTLSPNTKFAILSGYSDFEAAQAALKWKVEDYLIKPIDRFELNSLLERLIRDIHNKNVEDIHFQNISNALSARTKTLRELQMRILFENDSDNIDASLFNFCGDSFIVLFVKLDIEKFADNRELVLTARSVLAKTVNSMIDINQIDKIFCDHETYFHNTFAYCVINFNSADHSKIAKLLCSLKAFMQLSIQKYPGYRFSIGIGSTAHSLKEVITSAKQAKIAVNMRICENTENIFTYSLFPEFKSKDACISQDIELEISKYTTALNSPKLLACLHKFLFEFNSKSPSCHLLYQISENILLLFTKTIKNSVITEPADFLYSDDEIHEIVNLFFDASELKNFIYNYITDTIDCCLEQKQVQYSKPIRMSKQYVMAHTGEAVTLEEVSEYVNMSPNYFSKLFKEKTGISFPNYVLNCKIEKSKELLRDTFMSISEISSTVGYSDVRYFSRLFAKNVGIKPSEYRKFYS